MTINIIHNQLEQKLNLVIYQTKKDRIRSILENPNQVAINDDSIKNGRLWLVGFLNYVGYPEAAITDIIKNHNRWEDYKEEETNRQIHWLLNRRHKKIGDNENLEQRNCTVFTLGLEDTEISDELSDLSSCDTKSCDIIDLFFQTCNPININPPRDINKAVIYYHNIGFHMIPKIKDEKRPAIRWKIYQENQPPLYIVKRWNFINGIILLGTRMHSFLDIDIKSDKHDKGLENFDESRLKGWYYEKTQNGGYHIFGSGFFPKGMKGLVNNAVQIKHLGGYIVAYPTSGYTKSIY